MTYVMKLITQGVYSFLMMSKFNVALNLLKIGISWSLTLILYEAGALLTT
jgi:hypothetical protein